MRKAKHSIIELLEIRRLLSSVFSSGSITGFVFKDVNQDGVFDKGDALIAGRTVYLDTTSAGKYVKGDKTAVTKSSGVFTFTGLTAGTWYVHDENPANTAIIDPSATYYKETITAAAPKAINADFGEITLPFTHGVITGFVFKDVNQDGVDDKGDTLISGRTVYLDTTSAGKYIKGDKTAVTNSSGVFTFTGLTTGTWYVHDENPANTAIIDPSATYYKKTISVAAPKATGVNFGEITLPFTHGVITGTLFLDSAGTGTYKSTDAAIAGRTLYIDLTDKGSYVAGDPKAVTTSTGVFTFNSLKVGTYIVRDEVPAGRAVDDPSVGYVSGTISIAAPKLSVLIGEKAVPTTNFVGEFEEYYEDQLIVVDVRPVGTGLGSYNGDIVTNGVDLKFTGTESPSNVLSGGVSTPKGTVAFNATLSGKTMTVTYPSEVGVKDQLKRVSRTPAPAPPTLHSYTGSLFDYVAPSNWTVNQSDYGIVITSSDRTEQVGFIGTIANGVFGIEDVANSEAAAGAKFLSSKVLINQYVSASEYVQAGQATFTFTHAGTTYASAQLIETLTYYGSKTQTLTIIYDVTAPAVQFPADSSTLIYMLSQIKLKAGAAAAFVHVKPAQDDGSGYYDPGVSGDWSSSGGIFGDNPELQAEQSSLAYSASQFDQGVQSFDSYIRGSSGSAGSAAVRRPAEHAAAVRRGAVFVAAGKLQIGTTNSAASSITHPAAMRAKL
jgi:SdrD B-like domain